VDAIAETHGFEPPKKSFQGWAQQGGSAPAGSCSEARHLHERQRPGRPRRDGLLQEGDGDVTVFHDELDLAPSR
jgi:PTH1 family peptidyl-tRNA hydrolase